ncbi:MAG: hypothetical protein OHK0011_00850 [Turneriella sp.]
MDRSDLIRAVEKDRVSETRYLVRGVNDYAALVREMAKRPDSTWVFNPFAEAQIEIRSSGKGLGAFVYGVFAGFGNFLTHRDPKYFFRSTSR